MANKKNILALVLSIAVICLLAIFSLTFFLLYINCCGGFLFENKFWLTTVACVLVAIFSAIAIVFQFKDKSFVFRLCFSVLLLTAIISFFLYVLKITGFWEKVNSVNDVRNFIVSLGGYAVLTFIIMQILQVVVLPIPGIIMIGAGIAMFGKFLGGLYSFIGILIGSFIAFYIGRKLGYKAVKWLCGNSVDKAIESVKGKDRIVLSFMFLLPFFPDDVLCFVSGISSMSQKYFIIMITFTRLISVFLTSFSLSGMLIPFNTWWGIVLWGVVIILTCIAGWFIYKHGDKIENYLIKKIKRK